MLSTRSETVPRKKKDQKAEPVCTCDVLQSIITYVNHIAIHVAQDSTAEGENPITKLLEISMAQKAAPATAFRMGLLVARMSPAWAEKFSDLDTRSSAAVNQMIVEVAERETATAIESFLAAYPVDALILCSHEDDV
jgi:hypothetical protein